LIVGEVNSTYTFIGLAATKTFQAAIHDGTCESNKTSLTATVQNCTAPEVASTTAIAFIEGIVTIDLLDLVTDEEDNIDPSRLQITMQPVSGAPATLSGFELQINYAGFPFIGEDQVGIEVCDLTDLCSDQQITIELGGEIIVYNGLSPNNDGLNEFFKIQYIEILPETKSNQLFIYNRWGDEVFSVKDYNNDDRVFNGDANNGSKLPTGTYFYKVVFSSGKKTITGFLELKY
jgi:gliding motility-associated-like protein